MELMRPENDESSCTLATELLRVPMDVKVCGTSTI